MKRLFISTLFALAVLPSYAGIISSPLGNYTHDTDTDIVVGGGLEWLQWDVTVGMSIYQTLATYHADGWVLASNQQMADLFNDYMFGGEFVDNENSTQPITTGFDGDAESGSDLTFVRMFGDTVNARGFVHCYFGDCLEVSGAAFGNDADRDGRYKLAFVRDDYFSTSGRPVPGAAVLFPDTLIPAFAYRDYGVAIVRPVAAVPEPGTIALLGLGLAGLGLTRRKQR